MSQAEAEPEQDAYYIRCIEVMNMIKNLKIEQLSSIDFMMLRFCCDKYQKVLEELLDITCAQFREFICHYMEDNNCFTQLEEMRCQLNDNLLLHKKHVDQSYGHILDEINRREIPLQEIYKIFRLFEPDKFNSFVEQTHKIISLDAEICNMLVQIFSRIDTQEAWLLSQSIAMRTKQNIQKFFDLPTDLLSPCLKELIDLDHPRGAILPQMNNIWAKYEKLAVEQRGSRTKVALRQPEETQHKVADHEEDDKAELITTRHSNTNHATQAFGAPSMDLVGGLEWSSILSPTDKEIEEMITKAMEAVGKEGIICIEEI